MRQGVVGLLACVALAGQTPEVRPEFEVASIKPSAPDEFNKAGAGMHLDGSQVSWKFLSLHNYLTAAYRLKGYEILGPDWLASQRFDIVAKLPAGASTKQIPEMLQALLEDRFQIKTHREKKEFPVYGLVLAKGGLKMQTSPSVPAPESQGQAAVEITATRQAGGVKVDLGNGGYYTFGDNKFEGRRMSLVRMAAVLAAFMDRPVVDMTGVQGDYDFVLELSEEDFRAMGIRSAVGAGVSLPPQVLQMAAAASLDSLFNALEKLGLKLESRKAPIEVLVIDRAEKTPTEN